MKCSSCTAENIICGSMSSGMSCVLSSSNTQISDVLVKSGLLMLCKASVNRAEQPLHWRGHLRRSSGDSKSKEIGSSKSRNVEQDIPVAYKLSEGVECKKGALEKGRSFSLGPSMYPDEYYSRQRWPNHREAYPNKWREDDEHLDCPKMIPQRKVRAIEHDRASVLALAEERKESVPFKEDTVEQVKNSSSCKALRPPTIEPRKFWTFTQVLPCLNRCLYWREITLSLAISGILYSIIHLIFFRARNPKPSSIRRRIVRSQWYGTPSPSPWEQNSFERRMHLAPEHPRLIFNTNRNNPEYSFIQRNHKSSRTFDKAGMNKEVGESWRAPHKPIRQPLHGTNELVSRADKYQRLKQGNASNQKQTVDGAPDGGNGALTTERKRSPARGFSLRNSCSGRLQVQDDNKEMQPFNMVGVNRKDSQPRWGKEEELDLDTRISQLYKTIQSVERHRQAVMIALAEERQRSMLLEEKIVMQKQAAASLAKEVQLLKESHQALLTSFRKKYSSAAAARAAADLVYQDFEDKAAKEKQW